MCGIWADLNNTFTPFSNVDVDLIRQAMILTSLRGYDSSGIAMVDTNAYKPPKIVKSVGDPFYLINNGDNWDKLAKYLMKNCDAAFGHGRAATVGDITEKNAHPFKQDHITLVHNGTLTYGVDHVIRDNKEVDVDSHALCILMAQRGVAEALTDIHGPYAIIAHDSNEGCIYVARNADRPLAAINMHNRTLIMSEVAALEYLFARNTIFNAKTDTITVFQPETLYKWDLNTHKWEDTVDLKDKKAKKFQTWPNHSSRTSSKMATTKGGGNTGATSDDEKTEVMVICEKVVQIPNVGKGGTVPMWMYYFEDGDNYFRAISNQHEPERVGQLATGFCSMKETTIVETGEKFYSLRFRELEWYPEPEKSNVVPDDMPADYGSKVVSINDPKYVNPLADNPETGVDVIEPEVLDDRESLDFHNGRRMTRGLWRKICDKEYCALCDGLLREEEHKDVVLLNMGIVCGDCVTTGKLQGMGLVH